MRILFYYRGAEQFGIEQLSAILRQAGHETGLLYDPGVENTFHFHLPFRAASPRLPPRLLRAARAFRPELLAFSCLTNLYPYVRAAASELKTACGVPTIVGGIHPTVLPELFLDDPVFDIICRGEGETAMLAAVNILARGELPIGIPGLWTRDRAGTVHRTPMAAPVEDLDRLPFPDKELFYRRGAFWRNYSLLTGRGCPFRCGFCVHSGGALPRLVRRRSVENVLRELEYAAVRYRPRTINFQDDIFTLSPDWLERFAADYPRRVGIPFQCSAHPLTVTPRTVIALKRAGCQSVCLGIQSGDEQLRRSALGRLETDAQIEHAVGLLRAEELHVVGEFVLGLPGESEDQLWATVEFARHLSTSNIATFLFYPFPGTALAARLAHDGGLDNLGLWRTIRGEGSYHDGILHRYGQPELARNLAALLPFLPFGLSVARLRRLAVRPHRGWIRFFRLCGIPLMNTWQARERIGDLAHGLWRSAWPG